MIAKAQEFSGFSVHFDSKVNEEHQINISLDRDRHMFWVILTVCFVFDLISTKSLSMAIF